MSMMEVEANRLQSLETSRDTIAALVGELGLQHTWATMKANSFDRSDTAQIVRIQDEISKLSGPQLRQFWQALSDSGQTLFLWVVFLVEPADAAISVLQQTVIWQRCRDYSDSAERYIEAKLNSIGEREQILAESKRSIWRRIRKLEDRLYRLTRQRDHHKRIAIDATDRAAYLDRTYGEYVDDALNWRRFKELLS